MRMTDQALRRLALQVFVLVTLLYVVGLVGFVAVRVDGGKSPTTGTGLVDLAMAAMTFSFPVAGFVIARRQPRNRIGWVMLAIGLVAGLPSETYLDVGLRTHPGSLPGAEVVAAFTVAAWAPVLGLVATFPILLFPDGRLPSPRWRWVGWFSGLSIVWVYLLITFSPDRIDLGGGVAPFENPLGIPLVGDLAQVLLPTIVVLPLSFLLCAASLVQRFRRSRGMERLQLKWLASAGAFVAGIYLIAMLCSLATGISGDGAGDPAWLLVIQDLAVLSFCLIPIAIGVAILKHGLYGIDVVINKAVVFGALASFITAVYVGIVVGVGSLVGRGEEPNLALSIAAAAVVAVAFQPVRDRVQRVANRLVYGERATPYEVLSELADRVGGSYDAAELLPVMARTVGEGVAAGRVEVWLSLGAGLTREAAWPDAPDEDQPPMVAARSDLLGDRVVPVRHQGDLLGALTVTKPPAEPLTPAEERLLDDVAGQAGLVLRNVRLIEELRSSRQRLVTTQDEERRRLERNLHDGAQQSLVSVALMIRTVRARLGAADDKVGEGLDQAAEQLSHTIDELRELARGIHPAILTDRGLGPALRSLVERCPVPVDLSYGWTDRPPANVEGTVYFMVAEALTNVVKHARATYVTVVVAREPDALVLAVTDDGVGGADPDRGSGLRGLADRVAVVDGTLEIASPAGGTSLTARIPVAPRSPQPAPVATAADTRVAPVPVGADL